MGQYWKVVNLDKREFIMPHKLGSGLKLWEQLAAHPGTGAGLIVLLAAMPEKRGGGDLDLDANWHGPERDVMGAHGCCPGPMPALYPEIAHRTIGRWVGDRVVLVGDYAEASDYRKLGVDLSKVYGLCADYDTPEPEREGWLDISDDVAAVIEHELGGKYEGDGWREWTCAREEAAT
jgi:hypothetical protein